MSDFSSKDLQEFAEGVDAALKKFNDRRESEVEKAAHSPPRASEPTPRKEAIPTATQAAQSRADRAAAEKRVKKVLSPKPVYLVKIAVRKRQLSMDYIFEFYSTKLSRLEAQIDAKKAAKEAGYPIFGHVYDITHL